MCAILDSNVCDRVFGGADRPNAGKAFFDWINNGTGRLVIGGSRLQRELNRNHKFKDWSATAIQYGFLRRCDDNLVNQRESSITDLASNDSHIIALAIESGARLLCTEDKNLIRDFKNRNLIKSPKGSVYLIRPESKFDRRKRNLLERCSCTS